MKKSKVQKEIENQNENSVKEIYEITGVTDDEILLRIKKRRDENKALKKLLKNLNSTNIPNIMNKKSNL